MFIHWRSTSLSRCLILPEYVPEGSEGKGEMDMDEMDAMFVDAARMVVINQQGSASFATKKSWDTTGQDELWIN